MRGRAEPAKVRKYEKMKFARSLKQRISTLSLDRLAWLGFSYFLVSLPSMAAALAGSCLSAVHDAMFGQQEKENVACDEKKSGFCLALRLKALLHPIKCSSGWFDTRAHISFGSEKWNFSSHWIAEVHKLKSWWCWKWLENSFFLTLAVQNQHLVYMYVDLRENEALETSCWGRQVRTSGISS